ncbi:tetratricopeptide repeat protein [Streptomyces lonarensis]|uniref:Tetratricopeptide repeat protein n=1 Tax=Streptomyces lonarensis TaxID=700599 RepID=A0A7X6D365_9ACTN|nr:tetratricopeptide repeat protein [Streptomyces lonarensis]
MVLTGGGGYGTSQLAAFHAREALAEGTDLVVWARAAEEQALVTTFAAAAAAVRAPGATGENPVGDARTLLTWLATTDRSWLVVLDGVTDPATAQRWWPYGRAGWAMATTRLRDEPRLSAGSRAVVAVDVYTAEEATAFLHERLTVSCRPELFDRRGADRVAELIARSPLALGFAAAHIVQEGITCTAYARRLARGPLREVLSGGSDAEGYGRGVSAAVLLNLAAAVAAGPQGVVEPVLRLAALLDPDGHPLGLWATRPILGLLRGLRPDTGEAVTETDVLQALSVLHRYGVLTRNRADGARAVRIHALTARAAREATPPRLQAALASAAADALLAVWPEVDQPHHDLATALRSSTAALHGHAQAQLWTAERGGHPLLFRAGNSLMHAGLFGPAAEYWQELHDVATQRVGAGHRTAVLARGNLAAARREAGRAGDAIPLEERVLADRERLLGTDHPDTLLARGNLALSYRTAGRSEQAVALEERVLADRERLLGTDHPDTLLARGNLAVSYQEAGRTQEATGLASRVAVGRERLLGADHPHTLLARHNLALSYRAAGRTDEAAGLLRRVLSHSRRVLGDDHPQTLLTLGSLALAYSETGRAEEAVVLGEQVAAEQERLLGTDHPDTLLARHNLAAAYRATGRAHDGAALLRRVLSDSRRVLGDDHPQTLLTLGSLARSHWSDGRIEEAVVLEEQLLRGRERTLGPDHPATLTACHDLARSYAELGRAEDAIALEERALEGRARVLGPDHPHTLLTRANLAHSHWSAGRVEEAIVLEEHVAGARERTLGTDHPDTLTARVNLAHSYRDLGRSREAVTLLGHVLRARERVLGAEHPRTRDVRETLGQWTAERDRGPQD